MNGLVSIVTRTLGRPSLDEARASVAEQTYRPLEWVVVDAAGRGLDVPPAGDVPTRVVGTGSRLPRSPAANVGMLAARGEHLLWLDDDDLIRPRHIANLMEALARGNGARVAFSDIEIRNPVGLPTKYLTSEFSELKLCTQNLFPPVALLFAADLIQRDGCRVDESLDTFEDWDLWLQFAGRTRFVPSHEVTAIYRLYLSQSGADKAGTPEADSRCTADQATVLARYAERRARLEREQAARRDAARAAEARRDLAAAGEGWRLAAQADPYDLEALAKYAQLAFVGGNPAAARIALQRLADLAPDKGEVHWNLALVLDATGEPELAAKARARAVELVPALAQRLVPAP